MTSGIGTQRGTTIDALGTVGVTRVRRLVSQKKAWRNHDARIESAREGDAGPHLFRVF
jgi:hypothetical protein